jgi:hypothetical protein
MDLSRSSGGDVVFVGQESSEPEMLVDPLSNVPLKIYTLPALQLHNLAEDRLWVPPVRLTIEEEAIVTKPIEDGAILLLGRSGTGKTCCVTSRMSRDRRLAAPVQLKQLFVARNEKLCDLVRSTQVNAGENVSRARFTKPEDVMAEILVQADDDDDDGARFKLRIPGKYVEFEYFKRSMWDIVGRKGQRATNPLLVWTQIRSFIKGSYEAAKAGRSLNLDEYQAIARKRCRLDPDKRRHAYAIYEKYQSCLDAEGQWDDMDRTIEVVQLLLSGKEQVLRTYYDKIYLDEVQVNARLHNRSLLYINFPCLPPRGKNQKKESRKE